MHNQVQQVFDRAEQRLNRSGVLGELTRRYGLLAQRGVNEQIAGSTAIPSRHCARGGGGY
ncbi:MAG: hypothetical protein U0074_00070 [Kouleothrix sp.]